MVKIAHHFKWNFLSKKKGWLFYFFFLSSILFSQQPAYFTLGADQFKGVQIYDIIQDKHLNYWFATNEGLFYFDYLSYEKIECDESKSNSVFGFTMNEDGTLYCHNLNHQIFQIKNKKCTLFYELKPDEIYNDIVLQVADDGNLLIGGRKITVINKNGKVIKRLDLKEFNTNSFFARNDNKTQFHIANTDSVLTYSHGTFTGRKLYINTNNKRTGNSSLFFFNLSNESFAVDIKSKEWFKFDQNTYALTALPKNKIFERSPSVRINSTGNEVWVGGTLPGINLFTADDAEQGRLYYQDYFISDVLKDKEGNFLLGTFDKGVLVVPDLKIPDVVQSFREDPISNLYSDSDLGLVLGSSKGNLLAMTVNGQLKKMNTAGKRSINVIQGAANSSLILFDDGFINAYNKRTGKIIYIVQASLKDAVFISENTFYLGTNSGITKYTWHGGSDFKNEVLTDFNYRIYSLEYNPDDKLLYTTTANGMFVIDSAGTRTAITFQQKALFPNTLHYYDGKIYACDKKNGILVINKDKVSCSIQPIVNGKKVAVNKLIVHKNTLLVKTSDGLFQFDMNGNLIRPIHSLFGNSAKRILDFIIHNNYLWVSHSEGVQKIDLDYSPSVNQLPNLRIDKINVNDDEKSLNQLANFGSDKRKLQFILSVPTLQNHETIHYYYKLDGYENEWNINNYDANKITYNALAPGKYTFLAKAENQGKFSKTISYTFTIETPYYMKWWFISFGIVLFLLLVFAIYLWQLNSQRKKSERINEINISKLTAIQSQMNPHFIFNALNSIQDLVLKGDIENSYSYITTFSNLVRSTLNYSEKDFIEFDQEIKLLELYLSLEKLRFKKDFSFEIIIKNVEDIMLPPLLIQPFIENSLVHGLLHKEGGKKLKIIFELTDKLLCIVEDNGIGRESSKIIRQRQKADHESFSGKAIRNRFDILSTVYKGEYGYTYEDLYQNNKPAGTKVTLHIPIQRKF